MRELIYETIDPKTGYLDSIDDQPSLVYNNGDMDWHLQGERKRKIYGPCLVSIQYKEIWYYQKWGDYNIYCSRSTAFYTRPITDYEVLCMWKREINRLDDEIFTLLCLLGNKKVQNYLI